MGVPASALSRCFTRCLLVGCSRYVGSRRCSAAMRKSSARPWSFPCVGVTSDQVLPADMEDLEAAEKAGVSPPQGVLGIGDLKARKAPQ